MKNQFFFPFVEPKERKLDALRKGVIPAEYCERPRGVRVALLATDGMGETYDPSLRRFMPVIERPAAPTSAGQKWRSNHEGTERERDSN